VSSLWVSDAHKEAPSTTPDRSWNVCSGLQLEEVTPSPTRP
jgi:hypothetical protein